MTTVFLSHSSTDKDFVRRVADDLEANGVKVWLDERELLPGARLGAGLGDALEKCDCVLLFVSEAFLQSKWAGAEAEVALRKAIESNKVKVIPLLLEDVWDRASPLLQTFIYEDFRDRQNLFLYDRAIAQVLAAIGVPVSEQRPVARTVTVMVSGGRVDTGGKKGERIARLLGRALVAQSVQLLTGAGEGIDTLFAEGAAEEAEERGLDIRKVLASYTTRDGRRHHSIGAQLKSAYRTRREGIPEIVSKADVAFILGGSKNTMHLGVLMLLEGKILLPLAMTEGAAEDCYSLVLTRYDRVFRDRLPRPRFEELADGSLSAEEVVQKCIELLRLVTGQAPR